MHLIIFQDGVLTNVVSADGNYILHSKQIKIKDKIIIFNATDGCFGYLKTPMEFEYLILQTLLSSDNIIEWRDKLKSQIKTVYRRRSYNITCCNRI